MNTKLLDRFVVIPFYLKLLIKFNTLQLTHEKVVKCFKNSAYKHVLNYEELKILYDQQEIEMRELKTQLKETRQELKIERRKNENEAIS